MSKLTKILIEIVRILSKIKCIFKIDICKCESQCNQKNKKQEEEQSEEPSEVNIVKQNTNI